MNQQNYSTFNEKSIEVSEKTTSFDLFKGLFYMFVSCVLKSIFSFLCKLLLEKNKSLTSYSLLVYKAYFMFAITLCICLYLYLTGSKICAKLFLISGNNLLHLVSRSLLSVFSISLTTFALKFMNISDVYAIYYIYPGLVILLSYFFLKEKVGWLDYACLFCCFLGVIFVIRPPIIFSGWYPITAIKGPSLFLLLSVFIAALLKGSEDIIIRDVAHDIHFLSIPFFYSLVAIAFYPIPLTFSKDVAFSLSHTDLILVLTLSILCFAYQGLMTLAIQNENAGRAAMINYFQVLFMFGLDIFIFHRNVVYVDYLGIGLIFGFNFANGLKKTCERHHTLVKYKSRFQEENEKLMQQKKNMLNCF